MARNSLKNVCRLINAAKQVQPVEQSFVTDLKRSIELTNDSNARKPSQTYKPSGMHCLRNMYFQRIGQELDSCDSSACLIGICESGTDRHERIQNAVMQMKSNGMDCDYVDVADYVTSRNLDYLEIVSKQGNETKLYHKNLNISFLCDGIIRYNGHYYILEIKTESIYKWQARTGVDDNHRLQGTAYSTCFGINEVIFLYINRDNCDMKSYLFTVTDEMKNDFVGRIDECEQFVKQLKVPPIPEDVPKKICSYCNYKNSCKVCG